MAFRYWNYENLSYVWLSFAYDFAVNFFADFFVWIFLLGFFSKSSSSSSLSKSSSDGSALIDCSDTEFIYASKSSSSLYFPLLPFLLLTLD